MKLRIFTDGACSGNPGPGGWAAVFNLESESKTLSGCEVQTTNNRMELIAVVKAISKVVNLKGNGKLQKYDSVEIHSDSAYVVNAINNGWLKSWKKNGWKTSANEDVKNKELWKKLDVLLNSDIDIKLIKVKGHAGIMFNEMADKEARRMADIAKQGGC